MSSHMWGDKDFDWESLGKSISFCMKFWKRWGRIGSHGKEKYGTFRHHAYFWDCTIWGLFWPGWVWIGDGFWYYLYFYFDRYITKPFVIKTRFYKLVHWYQGQIYNIAIQKCCRKYPHIIDELVQDSDYPEYIKPGIFGKVDGIEIHNKYWTPPRKRK